MGIIHSAKVPWMQFLKGVKSYNLALIEQKFQNPLDQVLTGASVDLQTYLIEMTLLVALEVPILPA